MRLLRLLFSPLTLLWRLLLRPLQLRRRARALLPHGWLELHVEGEILELRPAETRGERWLRRILRQEPPKRVVLSRLRKMIDEALSDPHLKGLLVQVGPIAGGWAGADEVRRQLTRFRDAKVPVLVHLKGHAGNVELLVASVATQLWMTPPGGWAAVGSAAQGLFLQPLLSRVGIKFEVAARGRYKSAPEQLTRSDRSEPSREQTQALVDALDGALLEGLARLYDTDRAGAERRVDQAPLVGTHALAEGHCHALVRSEDLTGKVAEYAQAKDDDPKKRFRLVGAGGYLEARTIPPIWSRRKKQLGIVEVHGAIVDQAPGGPPGASGRAAVEARVVADLRAALADPHIGAVILHVNSRGGSVTASDGIYAAVRRLNQEKPVIACFGEVAASGGYYVACGARAIVASPLTVTGSIGVFAMFPTWPGVTERLSIQHDVIKNRSHAAVYDPWSGFDDEARALADREVGAMYEDFLNLVAAARQKTRDQIHAVAEGRVWIGTEALRVGLVDGLGGMSEAAERARAAYGKPLAEEWVLVKARGHETRPLPFRAEKAAQLNLPLDWLEAWAGPGSNLDVVQELAALVRGRGPRPITLAYWPWSWR